MLTAFTRCEWQAEGIDIELAAGVDVRADHGERRDELHVHSPEPTGAVPLPLLRSESDCRSSSEAEAATERDRVGYKARAAAALHLTLHRAPAVFGFLATWLLTFP